MYSIHTSYKVLIPSLFLLGTEDITQVRCYVVELCICCLLCCYSKPKDNQHMMWYQNLMHLGNCCWMSYSYLNVGKTALQMITDENVSKSFPAHRISSDIVTA